MRSSIIIAAHNEGELLLKTIESCIETGGGFDYEIVVADDASTDDAPATAERRFAPVRLYRHTRRRGVSPTRHFGAQQARGEVFIFLDAHSNPERGALQRLVRDIEETEGQAVITPRVAALDVQSWQNVLTQVGHGYAFDLLTIEARWVPLEELQRSPLGRGNLFESPALIGCAFAISRAVYEKIWGFDAHMSSWGVEDLDLAFKCWSMGHPILHDPEIVIGHRFQEAFTYSVPTEDIVVNQLRLAYKNYTHGVWGEWLAVGRQRYIDSLVEHPEGLWARAWELFRASEDSARQERSYLHGRRLRDEFWYAQHFGLEWPQLTRRGEVERPRPFLIGLSPSPSPRPSPSPSPPPLSVDIRAEDGTTPPCRVLGVGKSRNYRAVFAPAGGTLGWTCTGGASIVGSASAALVTVHGNARSATLDDVVLTVRYSLRGSSQTKQIRLTVADVTKITVRLKASAALTPGRGPGLTDHQFDCTETAEAFPAASSLLLLRGAFDDVELQATVNPVGTPLAWDVKRATDDAAALGAGLPTLVPDHVDLTKANLHTDQTGSFFVRAFGDCGNKTFDANGPFKLIPTVLVQATLQTDASTTNPANTVASIVGGTQFSVQTGNFDINNPGTAAIHMSATIDVVSGGAAGRRLIAGVLGGYVNDVRANINWLGSYSAGHAISTVFATNVGTGPGGIFRPGDVPNLVAPPLLDTGRANPGTGGDTATLTRSRIRSRTNQPLGERWIVESVDSPGTSYPLLHPVFSTPAAPVRLESFHFELHFSANLCLWTNRSGTVGDLAERSYGVLRSYNWDMLAEWNIDAANNITVVTAMSISISGGVTRSPLARPNSAACEVCLPTALSLLREDGRT
jgi:glycosyltransferase involved in cell wall biosynthesis